MGGRAELHFHLLPGIDDGPGTMDQSVELARAAAADGTRTIVATPHVRPDFVTDVRDLPDRVREVRSRLQRERIAIELVCGAELGHQMVGRLSQAELARIAVGPAHARWLLLEAPLGGLDERFHEAAEELRERGFGLVLAHPERSAGALAEEARELRVELERGGTTAQVSAHSLTGDNGEAALAAAAVLVAAGHAEAVASDAHSMARPPALRKALEAAVRAGIPRSVARAAVDSGPKRLLARGVAPGVPALAA